MPNAAARSQRRSDGTRAGGPPRGRPVGWAAWPPSTSSAPSGSARRPSSTSTSRGPSGPRRSSASPGAPARPSSPTSRPSAPGGASTACAGFLTLYRDVCRLLRGPADFALLARDLTARLRRERIVYAEVYVSPAIVERLGLDWLDVRDAVETVFAAHERRGGGRVRVLLDAVRHFGPDAAHRVLDLHETVPLAAAPSASASGATSWPSRRAISPAVYRRLPRLGLAPVVHAGEVGGPDSVAEALRWLRPRRIAHGVGAAGDPALVRRLARSGVALDVCLTSNAATGAVPARRSTRSSTCSAPASPSRSRPTTPASSGRPSPASTGSWPVSGRRRGSLAPWPAPDFGRRFRPPDAISSPAPAAGAARTRS